MATPFSTIYERASYRFSDHDILKYTDAIKESLFERYLFSAQSDFYRICKFDLLDRDDTTKKYNQTLDEECIEILSLGVAYYWVSAKVLNSELMKNSLKTSEYQLFSPEALLKTLQGLRTELKDEFKSKIIEYSYNNGNISELKV